MSEEDVRAAFRDQIRFCTNSGTPLTAAVLDAAERALDRVTATGRRILDWPGNARGSGDSVPLRLAGGLHALARSGADPALSALYAGALDTAGTVVPRVLRRFDDSLSGWLDSPPQTNETGRAAAIMAALVVLAHRFRLPFELIELGCSAGLNLNLDRFAYRLGTVAAGDPASPLRLAPEWTGGAPPSAPVRVVDRRGVDQAPIDTADPVQRERLIAYVWPDQPERMARIEAALAIADRFPPPVVRGDAADFAETELARPQADGVARVLFHTIHWTYLPPDKQARIEAALARAGAGADAMRPLAWARFELTGEGGVAGLWLTQWPGGETVRLATGHPHVKALRWEV
jgi:hypothetical protein